MGSIFFPVGDGILLLVIVLLFVLEFIVVDVELDSVSAAPLVESLLVVDIARILLYDTPLPLAQQCVFLF
jgi:hypothetical protein